MVLKTMLVDAALYIYTCQKIYFHSFVKQISDKILQFLKLSYLLIMLCRTVFFFFRSRNIQLKTSHIFYVNQ